MDNLPRIIDPGHVFSATQKAHIQRELDEVSATRACRLNLVVSRTGFFHVDIAHSLAYICRFGGHVQRFFSVAQHSMDVAGIAVELAREEYAHLDQYKLDEKIAFYRLAGLLHDASEGILGCDIPTPLKRFPGLES